MKKVYFFVLSLILLTGYTAKSQCTNTSAFGTVTAPTGATPVTISSCSFQSEYSTINSVIGGNRYVVTASIAGTFITIRYNTSSGTVVAMGETPLQFTAPCNGTYFAHWNTNSSCGTASSCMTTTIACSSCGAAASQCTNTSAFGTVTAPTTINLTTTITTCAFQGEYSTINSAVANRVYRITGSIAGTFITIRQGTSSGPVIASGVTPIAFTAPVSGTYFAHWNTNTSCGTASSCVNATITYIADVTCIGAVANDLCTGAININCGQTINGTTVGATLDAVGTCVTALNTAPGVWYSFTGDGSNVTLSLCGSAYDTKIGVFSGTCGSLTCVAGNDDFCGLQSQVTFTSVPGTNYFVLVTGFGTASGAFSLTRTCSTPCSGVPSPGSISPTSTSVCTGTPVTLTLSGYTIASGITFQWRESATSGGPYTNISGATGTSYSFTATATRYYVCNVTCTNPGGGTATTAQVVVNVSNPVHTTATANPAILCSPGTTTISAVASGGIGTYTHTLTGPGAIGAPVVSGANNTNVSFTVTGIPAGVHTYVLTSTDGIGCSKATNISVTVNQTPFISLTTTPAPTGGTCAENFDGVTTPVLPAGWSATFGTTCAPSVRWATSTVSANSAPNSVFTNDPNCISDEYLNSRTYSITAASQLTFRRNHILETGFDGMVLEISIGGGAFTDIITAGGSFVTGGYTHTISSSFGSPIAGRQAWSGNSGGWVTTTVNLPAAAIGQTVVLRWRRATDNSVSSTGVYIDDVSITNAGCGNVVICNGAIVRIDASQIPTLPQTFNNNINTHIPAGGTTTGVGSPYPSALAVSGLPVSGVTVSSVTINGFSHTLPDDVDLVLVSPSGQSVILMSDAGGSAAASNVNYTFDDAAASLLADNAANPSGTYRPTNYGAGDNWPAPGPGSSPTSTTLATFTGNPNGNWNLFAFDDATNNIGIISTWSITFNVPQPVVFSPVTNLFTDAAATVPYTGAPVFTVWAKPNTTTTYTATSTINSCTGSSSVGITVNQLPAITTQPTPLAAPVCPGFNVTYSVGATGTGITYQWQASTDNGTTWNNISNGVQYSGTTTASLTVLNVQTTQNGHRFRVIVSGTCPPPVTSNVVILVVSTPPTITTQPANRIVCAPDAATFSVVAGGVPAPNIYQWQVSTDAGATWTNLTTGGSYTPTLTVSPTATSQNNNRYRVIVTNSCGQSVTSAAAILTVNARTPVTIAPLPSRICLSDTLVPLTATPVGGSWSGIGISGFNFVPPITAVGSYTLTYTYTNAANCTSTGTVVANVQDCPERIRQLDENAVILYPNPNNGHFNIRINSVLYNYLGMTVYNTMGQRVFTQNFTGLVYGRVVPINLSSLPSGTYMIKFFYDDGIRTNEKTFPVVIQR